MAAGFQKMVDVLRSGLPAINDMLTATGSKFGEIATTIGETVTRADNLSRIRDILGTNVGFLDQFKAGLSGLITSFLILFDAAKPFIDAIGQMISQFGQWASATLAAKEANGQLGSFMQTLLDKFKGAASAIGDFVVGLYNVGRAAAPAGGSLADIAQKFRDWTGDAANQERMTAFFDKMHTLVSALAGLFGGLAGAAAGALEKMNPEPMLKVFTIITDKIAPALADLWNQVQAGTGENLVKIFDNLGTMLEKIVASGTFEKIANFFSTLLEKISEFAASDFGSTVAGWLIPLALFGGTLSSLIGPLTSVIGAFAGGTLGAAAGIVAAIAAAFVLVYTNSEAFRNSLGNLVSVIGGAFTSVWDKIGPKVQVVWEKITALAEAIGNRLAPVIDFLAPVVERVFGIIGDLVSSLMDIFSGFIDFVTGILTGNWQLIWQAAGEVLQGFWGIVQTVFGAILSFISFIWDGITAVVYNAGQVLYGIVNSVFTGIADLARAIWQGITDFLSAVWNGIVNVMHFLFDPWIAFFSQLWTEVQNVASNVWNAITSFFSAVWNGIVNTMHFLFDPWIAFFSQLWTEVQNVASNIWNAISNFFVTIWNSIYDNVIQRAINLYNGIVDWFERAGNFIQSVWNGIPGFLRGIWDAVFDAVIQPIINVYNGIVDWFTRADDFVSNVFDGVAGAVGAAFSGVYDAIVQPIINAYNSVVGWIGNIKSAITSAWDTVSGIVSNINSALQASADKIVAAQGANNALAPATAEGGIFRPTPGGQLRTIAEAGQSERVEPLDPSGLSVRDHAIIDKLVSMAGGSGGAFGTPVINVFIGERELTDIVSVQIDQTNSKLARNARNGRS
jgi:phage-related protein